MTTADRAVVEYHIARTQTLAERLGITCSQATDIYLRHAVGRMTRSEFDAFVASQPKVVRVAPRQASQSNSDESQRRERVRAQIASYFDTDND